MKMANIIAYITDDKLIIELPVNEPLIPSKSGKTLVVASSYGNRRTNAEVDGKQIYINLTYSLRRILLKYFGRQPLT